MSVLVALAASLSIGVAPALAAGSPHSNGNGNSNGNGSASAPAASSSPSSSTSTSAPAASSSPSSSTSASAPAASSSPSSSGPEQGIGAGDKGTNGNSNGGGGNFGDVYLQTAGPCVDRNEEVLNHGGKCEIAIADNETDTPRHTPHLPCANIEVMGKNMRDASGDYTLDSIPPSGGHIQVYGFNHDADQDDDALPAGMVLGSGSDEGNAVNNGDWTYDKSAQGNKGDGRQVMDVIDVQALVHNAIVSGAEAHPIQGYHFKLQFVQAPQKHKTFWVNCNAPSRQPGTDCDNDNDNSSPTDADCQVAKDCDNDNDNSKPTDTDCQGVQGTDCDHDNDASNCAPGTGTVLAASTTTAGAVQAASIANPNTGRNGMLQTALIAAAMMVFGSMILMSTAIRRRDRKTI